MNKKIKKEQRHLVEAAKLKILALSNEQDVIFNDLIEQLNIENDCDIDWISDFIYNAGTLSDEYFEMVESAIFE